MNKLILAACVLALAGCGSTITRSEVPVTVKCVKDLPVRPVYRTASLPPDASEAEKIVAIALDWLNSRPYEAKLEAGLVACQ